MNAAINGFRAFALQAKSYGFTRAASRSGVAAVRSLSSSLALRRALIGAGVGAGYNVGSDLYNGYGFSLSRAMSGAVMGSAVGLGYNAARAVGMGPVRDMGRSIGWAARDIRRGWGRTGRQVAMREARRARRLGGPSAASASAAASSGFWNSFRMGGV